ncbi:hypothetical protein K525DRAFT_266452 [Schizophyllum commune Loenen D]|nr:hypothetical protein K525DRAFT_266452 [Schizophyllum commune Loenen D]
MPLFSKNHHTTTTGTHGASQYDQYGAGTTGTHHGAGTGPTHHGVGTGPTHHSAGTTGNHHYGTENAYEGMGGHTAPHGREYAAEPYGNNFDHRTGGVGTHAGPGVTETHGPGYQRGAAPPTTHGGIGHHGGGVNAAPATGTGHAYGTGVGAPRSTGAGMGARSSGSGHETMGKMEHALGTLVSSNTLKARGAQKEQEGRTLKELGEADRMEEEANIRRERALARGPAPGAGRTGGY